HVREVPDHQEVFVNVAEDQSVIVEILELVTEATDDACAAFHFNQLAEDNDAEDASEVQSVSLLNNSELPSWPAEARLYFLLGQQRIAKFNEQKVRGAAAVPAQDARNLVQIMMFVVRLPRQETDIVVSYNVPLHISDSSSSKKVAHEGNIQEAEAWFRNLVGSFEVKNWGLFK
ncbi:hypothetical protein BGZ99_003381, partial [Dissophora globulifera]